MPSFYRMPGTDEGFRPQPRASISACWSRPVFIVNIKISPGRSLPGGERAARLGTDGHRFQTEGVNRKSIGKISRRPISISPVRINFEKFENAE